METSQCYSQVDKQHGTDHHDESAEGGVEVDNAEEDASTRHCVQPVQPIAVQLIFIQHSPTLCIHLDVSIGLWVVR